MPQLGFMELVVIFIVALLVFGPKKLPDLGKSLGKGLREFRKATDDLKANWEEQVRDAENSVSDIKQTIQETKTELETVVTAEDLPKEESVPDSSISSSSSSPTNEEVKPDAHAN